MHLGKVRGLTSLQASQQKEFGPPGFYYHIDYVGLKAFYNVLLALLPHVKDCAVKIMSDNILL